MIPPRFLVDTNVWIIPPTTPIPGNLLISTITIAELELGILAAPDATERDRRKRRLDGLKSRYDPLPIDPRVSESYGVIGSITVRAGKNRRGRCMDLLIAATAHAHDLTLATRNVSDFEHLQDVINLLAIH